ncbi:hypothetical protein RGQ29_002145 [Quercus rubra]|uniref:Uncharacterized protein n=1 Tax=Quercus rubra TaxID=3512 RepID=A0AAN7GIR7_QUERU|nr:hypothetical protein RGQ29_002145 [Quercus rubra]
MKDGVVFQRLQIICYQFLSSGLRNNLAQFISSNLIGQGE